MRTILQVTALTFLLAAGPVPSRAASFLNATPAFDAAAPTSSILSSFDHATFNGSYDIALVGLAGGLVVNDMGIETQSASIQVSAPEPASLAMLAMGLVGMLGYRRQRRSSTGA